MSETLVLKGWVLFCFLNLNETLLYNELIAVHCAVTRRRRLNFSTSRRAQWLLFYLFIARSPVGLGRHTDNGKLCLFFKNKPILGSRAITPLCRCLCPSATGCANHTALKMLPAHSRQELVPSSPFWFAWCTPAKILSQPTETTCSRQQEGFKIHGSSLCPLWTMKRKPRIC